MSDTHGDSGAVKQLLENCKDQVSAVVHLGDHTRDIMRVAVADKAGVYHIVNGNTDSFLEAYKDRVIEVGGKRIFITHGHRYDVKIGIDMLIYKARELQVDACLFGHTHVAALFKQSGIVFLNPGSLTNPRPGLKRGYGMLSISEEGTIAGKLLVYKGATW